MLTIPVLYTLLSSPPSWPYQEPGPYSGTNQFLDNYFFGMGGIGLWLIFTLIAIAAVVWVFYDSQQRRLPATIWRIGVLLSMLLLLPSMLFRFSVNRNDIDMYYKIDRVIDALYQYQDTAGLEDLIRELESELSPPPPKPLTDYHWTDLIEYLEDQLNNLPALTGLQEPIAYIGILGGLVAAALAAAYYVTYRGLVGCPQGHVYDETLADCPECGRQAAAFGAPSGAFPSPAPVSRPLTPQPQAPVVPPPPVKPKAHAWLVSREGKTYQLNLGDTTIGRSARNDIQLTSDTTLSKQHAKIVEQNGHFRIFDLGSTNGTRVNDRRLRQAVLLDPDDEIQLGDHTFLRFVTTRR